MKNRILLVEDDSTLSMIISETLQRDGFEVMTAGNGEDGFQKFAKHGADLIVRNSALILTISSSILNGFLR